MKHHHANRNGRVLRLLFLGLGVVPAAINLIVAGYAVGSVPELDHRYLVASAAILAVSSAGVAFGRSLAAVPLPGVGGWLAIILVWGIGEAGEGFVPVLIAGFPAAVTILAAAVALPTLVGFRAVFDRPQNATPRTGRLR